MPKHSGLIDHDPDREITKIFHRLHDGDWAYETIQNTDPIIEANKWNQSFNPISGNVPMKRVASIPVIFIEKWKRELGIDYWSKDPAMQRKVDALLNSSEWKWLRTDESVL
jgi:hypothetical protein